MKKSVLTLYIVVLLFSGLAWWAGTANKPVKAAASNAGANDPADVQAIKQLEQEMGDEMVAGDVARLSKLYADDFVTVGSDRIVVTKDTLLHDFNSFHDKLEWFENGPIDVQLVGNLAVAQATVKEKRSLDGKDTIGEFLWVDILKKRDGKWEVVRSAGARIK